MKKKILVVGDIMFDHYVYVTTERKAAEAPIPVWDQVREEIRLGGAANVANNLRALDDQSSLDISLLGICDSHQEAFGFGIHQIGIYGESMTKVRYVDEETKKIVFRTDDLKRFDREDCAALPELFKNAGQKHYDAIIFSDYGKGTITPDLVDELRTRSPIRVVDSKQIDLTQYRDFEALKINEHEYSDQVSKAPYKSVEELFGSVIVTLGAKGAELRQIRESSIRSYVTDIEEFKTEEKKVVDVTGCGDTFTAALTYSLLLNSDIRRAIKFANACAGSVVQKFGTSLYTK